MSYKSQQDSTLHMIFDLFFDFVTDVNQLTLTRNS